MPAADIPITSRGQTKMIKAVFFDIDGTLYSHKAHQIPESACKALKKLQEQGILIFTATGRHMIMIEHLLGDLIPFDGYVSLTGQICLDRQKHVFYKNPICQADTEKIAAFFRTKRRPLTLIEENRRYTNMTDEKVSSSLKNVSSFAPPIEDYCGGKIYQAAGFFTQEDAKELLSCLDHCKFTSWDEGAIDIIPADGGKTVGIQKLLEHYNLTSDSIMAFGDGDNDVDMLEFAQIGVAMGNASQKAKAAADYITTDIDDHGIAHALKHFHLI